MQYLIHQEKMDELNVMVGEQGSPANSAVSDALAAGDIAKATEACKLAGKAWENVQRWHDKRINEDQYGGSPGNPTPHPGPLPPGTVVDVEDIHPDGVNHAIKGMQPNGLYCYKLLGDKPGHNVSFARPGGWCNIAYGAAKGSKDVVGQAANGTAIMLGVQVPAGSWVTMWLNDDASPAEDATYSAAPVN